MNDALRKKLTEQQELVKEIQEKIRVQALIAATRPQMNLRERDIWYRAYMAGVKCMANSINDAIQIEKQRKGREK